MAKLLEPIFEWDPEAGIAMCILSDGKNSYCGSAYCSEEDQDMKSEKTGCYIAEGRARINYLVHLRDNEILPKYEALHELYYAMIQSKRFNEDSYEVHMLQKKMSQYQFEIEAVRDMLKEEKATLKEYMRQKAILYKKVRENRATDKSN